MTYQKVNVTNKKYLLGKLYQGKDIKFYLKERKESSIKGHKTRYYLQDSEFHNFSSLFENPDYQKTESEKVKGNFNLELGKPYYLDNKGNYYKVIFDFDKAEITALEVQNELL